MCVFLIKFKNSGKKLYFAVLTRGPEKKFHIIKSSKNKVIKY